MSSQQIKYGAYLKTRLAKEGERKGKVCQSCDGTGLIDGWRCLMCRPAKEDDEPAQKLSRADRERIDRMSAAACDVEFELWQKQI